MRWKDLTRRFPPLCVALLLVCGCAAPGESSAASEPPPASSPAPSSAAEDPAEEPEPSWEDYTLLDINKELVTFWSEEITAVDFACASAWVPGREGTLRLEEERYSRPIWGKMDLMEAGSRCLLLRGEDGAVIPRCIDSGYSFDCREALPGVLRLDSGSVLFFPYRNDDLIFPRLEPRDEEREKALLENAVLPLADGNQLEIEPLAIELQWEWDRNAVLEALGLDELEGLTSPRWYDVELNLEFIWAGCCPADPDAGETWDHRQESTTRFTGSLHRIDTVSVKGELELSGPVWRGFAPWAGHLEPLGPLSGALWEGSMSEQGELLDWAGEAITPWASDRLMIDLSYTYGWDMDQEGYVRLTDGETAGEWGSVDSLEARSVYYIFPKYTGTNKLELSQSSYRFTPRERVSGILQIDRYAVLFYPYRSVEEPFYRVEPRDRDKEKESRKATVLSGADGSTLEIKPIAVQFGEEDEETLLRLVGIGDREPLETPRWFDVQMGFSSVNIKGWSDNLWEVLSTGAFGTLTKEPPLLVKEELTLTDRVWTGFAHWCFQAMQWEE